MKIPIFRFSWLEYYSKQNIFLKILKYCYGTLFLHSRVVARFLFRSLEFEKNEIVLDIGCGDGNFANWISFHVGCKVIGIDRLPQRIQLAKITAQRYKLPNEFLCLDIEKEEINFKKEYFDKILMIDVLEHFKNPRKIIQRVSVWLKGGGILFISTPAKNQNRIFLHGYKNTFDYGEDQHFFEGFDIRTLINWLKENGFTGEIRATYIFYEVYQFTWELSELIRKRSKIFYSILLPLFELLTFLDRPLPFSKGRGNGIIIIAKK
jgi:2-polyprenyl-3-methyl-5-hydroxy-6-metoxy-1,4-benzoquinol methylase